MAVSAAGAMMAIDWVATGIYYALADTSGRPQASGGIVALFSLDTSMTYVAGLVILALSLMQFGPRALPPVTKRRSGIRRTGATTASAACRPRSACSCFASG